MRDETYSVSELTDEIRDLLAEAYAGVWVAGEVQRVRSSQRGHLYFELIEKGRSDRIVGKVDRRAVAIPPLSGTAKSRRERPGDCRRATDPVLGADRFLRSGRPAAAGRSRSRSPVHPRPTRTPPPRDPRRLAEAGLLEANRELPLSEVPLDIGLVTSKGSAAYHDFLASLAESGYGFRVFFVHAAMQGREAERQVASALRMLGGAALDTIVLIRGGGSRTDLAAFDSRVIAEAVARCPLPVLTGLVTRSINRSPTG